MEGLIVTFIVNVFYRLRERLTRPPAPVYVQTDDYTFMRYRSDRY